MTPANRISMHQQLKVLCISDMNVYAKGRARARALTELGVEVIAATHTRIGGEDRGYPEFSLAYRVAHRLGYHLDTEQANRTLRDALKSRPPDLVWIEKGTMIRPSTLRHVKTTDPRLPVVSYSDDDMFLDHNRTRAYVKGLGFYDCVFTTKAPNRDAHELPALGARRVVVVDKAFDAHQHHPVEVGERDREELGGDVGFIGTYERDRAQSLLFLAQNGVRVRVWGNGWESLGEGHPNLRIEGRAVVNTEADLRYTRAICATRINLGFLRKLNRDRHTDRSVEIPACAGFLLAERSEEHVRLFAEDREAVFFATPDELLAKVRHYLAHETERAAIAEAGRRRCLDSDYSETGRMRFMLAEALGPPPTGPGAGRPHRRRSPSP